MAVPGVLESTIKSITIRTSIFPPIVINEPFLPSDDTAPTDYFMQFVKPEIEIATTLGRPLLISPYGRPTVGWAQAVFPLAVATLAITGALAFFGAISLATGGEQTGITPSE